MTAECVRRAQGLVGTRFRPQGRSAERGLDCIGLVVVAFDLPERLIRRDYGLRGGSAAELHRALRTWFEPVAADDACGDVWVVRPRLGQLHLLMLVRDGFVHGDAGLGRIVAVPGRPPGPALSRWRRKAEAH